ncbi:hypothetical protein ONO57_26310, partial [Salmonella enterica subsp. enterica serovar Anatum]|nr:hypothetical protein [Salmonella enterica subsp. enterica serovar Anatum]
MGDAGCNIIFGAIMLFVNYFYTDIFGLAPALVGVLLLSVRVIGHSLFQLLCVAGDWSRALHQLQLCARMEANYTQEARLYRELVR